MKKYIIAFLFFSVFAGVFAQSYTPRLNKVFQLKDVCHALTGIQFEQMLPNEKLIQHFSSEKDIIPISDDTVSFSDYKHSVGINIGWLNGVSLKFNLKNNVYLQADLGIAFSANPLYFIHDVFGPFLYLGYGGQVCVLYENKFSRKSNMSWIAGGGVHFSKSIESYPSGFDFKSGVNMVLGIEWTFKIPLSLQLDTRQGYGVLFAPIRNLEPKSASSIDRSWHYFDYSFVFSIRYCFGKKINL